MKLFPLMALAGALCVLALAHADDTKSDARAWLDARGVLTVGELETTLDTRFSADERTKMEALLAERNAALRGYNARVTQLLRETLATTDAGVTARVEKKIETDKKAVDAAKEAAELERIRRHQPSRYQAIMRKKQDDQKKEADSAPTAAPQPASAP